MRLGAPFLPQRSDDDEWEQLMLLQGTQAAFAVQNREKLHSLADAEFRVFSQFGDDGIIEWLVAHLPGIPPSFVEFGVEDYLEANTRFLLRHRNWRGLVMDSSAANVRRIQGRRSHWRYDLTAIAAHVDQSNIDALLSDAGFRGDIGLLHIDIDGNDYWIWKAISVIRPWIVIVEYNAVFGDLHPIVIPYDPAFSRQQAHSTGLYFGASIRAFEDLAKTRGYLLLGTNRAGNNAYFVSADAASRVEGRVADRKARPSMLREARGKDGLHLFIGGSARSRLIRDRLVIDLSTGSTVQLGQLEPLYSAQWLEIMDGQRD
jgi:hypothetical protein